MRGDDRYAPAALRLAPDALPPGGGPAPAAARTARDLGSPAPPAAPTRQRYGAVGGAVANSWAAASSP